MVSAICSPSGFFFVLRSGQYSSRPTVFKPWQIRLAIWLLCLCWLYIALSGSEEYMNLQQQKIAAATVIATSLAVAAEGLRHFAYYDPPGVLTVCYGHTGPDVRRSQRYSLEECKTLLTDDMNIAVAQVSACVPNAPESVLAAFSDAVFNMGPTIACNTKKSTAARYLQQGNWAAACQELPRWNKATVAGNLVPLPGLTKRRQAEMSLCLGGL